MLKIKITQGEQTMKILSMLKVSTIMILLSTSLYGFNVEKKIISYEKFRVSQNPAVEIKKVDLAFKKDLGDGWIGYLFKIDLVHNGQDVSTQDILYSNGKVVTTSLQTLTGGDYRRMMHPTLDARYTDKKNLIAGNHNAKNKIVIFSDPLCPNCTMVMPGLIKDVQANPDKLGLYYINMPLDRLHPTARTLIKATKIAVAQGIKDVHLKVYTAQFEKLYKIYEEKDSKVALNAFNKVLGTKITMKQLENKQINDDLAYHIQLSEEAMIAGTPTIFFNNEVDITRDKYKEVIK
jgi:protein-disulfide isomerase